MSTPEPTFYDVLGVQPSATRQAIRAAHRALVAQHHPDKHVGNPLQDLAREKLVQINRAYAILSDPQKRAEYDAQLGHWQPTHSPAPIAQSAGQTLLRTLGTAAVFALLLRWAPVLLGFIFRSPGVVFAIAILGFTLYVLRRPKT